MSDLLAIHIKHVKFSQVDGGRISTTAEEVSRFQCLFPTGVTRTQAQGLYTDNNPEFFKNL